MNGHVEMMERQELNYMILLRIYARTRRLFVQPLPTIEELYVQYAYYLITGDAKSLQALTLFNARHKVGY